MRKAAPLWALLAAACYVGPPRYYSPPPAPPAPPPPAPRAAPAPAPAKKMLTESEAVSVATGYARANGVEVNKVKHAHLDGAGRWHVELRGDRNRDKAKVMVDAWTGQVIKASLRDND
ncbi:MAG TPA: hypothetical protein VFR85_10685 [Anaeromyxobacteraceae bacterium]|nr:hypothetical protein [Anaeromyxobacteraceae bacterium]